MTNVVIQPSFGSAAARAHWRDSLDRRIDFRTMPFVDALSSDERAVLDLLHPDGKARFWGATSIHDARMQRLRTGDVVLFTGGSLVRAVGEVGFSFQNSRFADLLWSPDPKRGSYRNVYSLLNFQATGIPYSEIWELPGFNSGDNFMGLRVLDSTKADVLIDGLGIHTATSSAEVVLPEAGPSSASTGTASVVASEAMNVAQTTYERPAGWVLVNRTEALLVQRYKATLGPFTVDRIRTPVGVTDLYVVGTGWRELVEAKSSADHAYVRQALGQLLDYVTHGFEMVDRLSALFPSRPSAVDVGLLHRYGIDCIYETSQNVFIRVSAPELRRDRMVEIWSSEAASD